MKEHMPTLITHRRWLRNMLAVALLAGLAQTGSALEPTDPNATPATVELMHYIVGLNARTTNRVLSGQCVDNTVGSYTKVFKACHDRYGYWPAIMQSHISYTWVERKNMRQHMNLSFIYPLFYNHHRRGGVCMLLYNPYNPFLGTTLKSAIPAGRSATELLTSSDDLAYRVFHEDIALLAQNLKVLEEAGIPVILRIFGEYTSRSGFWYQPAVSGEDQITFAQLKALYQEIWKEIVNVHDVHNILYMTECSEAHGHYMDLYDEDFVDIPGTKFRWFNNAPCGEFPAHKAITAGCDKPILIGQANIKNFTTPNTFDLLHAVTTYQNNPEAVGGTFWWNTVKDGETVYMAIVDQKNVKAFFQHPTIIDRTETPWGMSNPPAEVPWDITLPETQQSGTVTYNFNGDTTQGWSNYKSVSNANANDNRLHVFYYGVDPTVQGPDNMNLNTASANRFVIRMRNDSLTERIILQWQRTTDSGFSAARSLEIPVGECEQDFVQRSVALAGHPDWNGTIRRLRLRLAPDHVWGSSEIDYILLDNGAAPTLPR